MSVYIKTIERGWSLVCEHCAQFNAVEAPVDARMFVAKVRAFITMHESCASAQSEDTQKVR